MTKPQPDVIEKRPTGTLLPPGWRAANNMGFTYRVHDGDSWESVAKRFMVDVKDLIHFNFMTTVPAEVNWYLRSYVGCNKRSPSGYNWMFSNSARPGIIFIPPADHDPIDADPEVLYAWTPESVKKLLSSLDAVAKGMSGNPGERIRNMMKLAISVGYPACKDLWYYNPGAVLLYVGFHTNEGQRRDMTRFTKGTFPFDGDSGMYGPWRIYPFKDLMDEFAAGFSNVNLLKHRLEWIDDQMYQGWHQIDLADAQSSQGGGSGFGPSVSEFVEHVHYLAQQPSHMYSAFQQ